MYQPGGILIAPVNPAVYYVPIYDPWIVYGAPLPVYPAYYYAAPPPSAGSVAVAAAVGFTAGFVVGAFSSYGGAARIGLRTGARTQWSSTIRPTSRAA